MVRKALVRATSVAGGRPGEDVGNKQTLRDGDALSDSSPRLRNAPLQHSLCR